MTGRLWLGLPLAALLLAATGWAVWAHAELRQLSAVVQKAEACDDALARPDRAAVLFAIRASCTAPIQDEVAARAAAEAGEASANTALNDALAGSSAAVERAEARGIQSTNRRTTADDTIRAAPGTADRRRCDAECLRQLGG